MRQVVLKYATSSNIKITCCYGGAPKHQQARARATGGAFTLLCKGARLCV